MSQPAPRNVIIIGSGPTGYTAAVYAARARRRGAQHDGGDRPREERAPPVGHLPPSGRDRQAETDHLSCRVCDGEHRDQDRTGCPHGASSRAPAAPSAAPNAAAVTVAPSAWSPTAAIHLQVRSPYPTGLMVSTIERPQGPNSVEMPATIEAITSGTRIVPLNT